MKSSQDDHVTDEESNPFLQLFPNANHAKQYIEATRSGLERSTSYSSQDSTESSTPSVSSKGEKKSRNSSILDKFSSSSKQFRKTIEHCRDVIINDYIQRIFLLTVNSGMSHKVCFSDSSFLE